MGAERGSITGVLSKLLRSWDHGRGTAPSLAGK